MLYTLSTTPWIHMFSTYELNRIIGLFCKRALYKRLYSAKETCNFKEPANSSHPIGNVVTGNCRRQMLYALSTPPVEEIHPCGYIYIDMAYDRHDLWQFWIYVYATCQENYVLKYMCTSHTLKSYTYIWKDIRVYAMCQVYMHTCENDLLKHMYASLESYTYVWKDIHVYAMCQENYLLKYTYNGPCTQILYTYLKDIHVYAIHICQKNYLLKYTYTSCSLTSYTYVSHKYSFLSK